MIIDTLSLSDNVWCFGSAILLICVYNVPVSRWWDRFFCQSSSSSSSKQQIRCQQSQNPSHGKCTRKVKIISSLPHPSTDTTEVSDDTESSDLTDDPHYHIMEADPRTTVTTHAFSTPVKQRPVDVVGPQTRLADIPEAPSPAVHSALKLKHKLLRQNNIACGQSVASGSSDSHTSHRRRQSATTLPTNGAPPKLPPRSSAAAHKRHKSADRMGSRVDTMLLERITRDQS